LPAEARERTYAAKIVEGRAVGTADDLVVTLAGAKFLAWGSTPGFVGARDGSAIRFTITSNPKRRYTLIELIGEMRLTYDGVASTAVTRQGIAGPFDGTVGVYELPGNLTFRECVAIDHRIRFTR
jgi:hypothetical protein